MPFDPNFPFDPTDPSQWWQLRNLLRPSAQPTAPPNTASGTAAQSSKIDVPEDDGLPNDWFVPEADGYPNDWFVPDADGYAPTPGAAPRAARPAPSPRTNAANPTTSNRPPAPFDPLAAYWAQVPASRVGVMAWHPPIFLSPDSFAPQITPSSARGGPPAAFSNPLAQFLPATSALPTLPPDFGRGGILGGIARMAAERARANDPWALPTGGILGGIPKLAAAQARANDPWALPANGILGGIAKLSPASASLDTGLFGGTPNRPSATTDATASFDPLNEAADQAQSIPQTFARLGLTSTPADVRVASDYHYDNGFGSDQQIRARPASDPSNQSSLIEGTSARDLPPSAALGDTSAESSPVRTAQADIPSSPGMIGPALRAAVSAGHLTEEEAAILQQRANALGAGRDARLQAALRAGLPEYDGVTTYGVLITNEGNVVPLQSGGGNPLYGNYSSAGHVEGKAAIWIRENGSSGGVLYHNNPGGTCGRCNGQIRRLLPEGARLRVVSPENAVPKNRRARVNPPPYVGDSAEPKPPEPAPPNPQPDLLEGQQP
jgi:hypothetical protein